MEKIVQKKKVFLPEYTGGSITNVSSSILKIFGVEPSTPPLREDILPLKKYRGISKVVLFIFDSLGFHRLKSIGPLNEYPVSPITTVFPSTTASALTSLYTAETPSKHGMVGFRLFLKEYGLLVNMIKLSPAGFESRDRLRETGFDPKRFLPVKTVFQRLEKRGVRSFSFTRMHYYKSGLSSLLLKGSEIVPYVNIVDLLINIKKLLHRIRGKVFITAYVDDFDITTHYYGIRTEEEETTIRVYLKVLKELFLRDTFNRTLILLTSDHGQVPSPSRSQIDIRKYKGIHRGLLMPPTGEFRASYLYLKKGSQEKVTDEIRKRLGEKFLIFTRDEAIRMGLFGGKFKDSQLEGRLGDVMVISKDTNYLYYPYSTFELKARHGGLHRNEMEVPFIVF
jgi:hypothetical protein